MGCDIHMAYQKVSKQQKRENKLSEVFEDKSSEINSEWEFIEDGISSPNGYTQFSNEDRNYYWFSRMSEVRGDGPRITEIGFPDGVEVLEYRLGDHSYSHVYLNTLLDEEWDDEDKTHMSTFINDDIPRMVQYCDREGLRPDEFRILIGYDS